MSRRVAASTILALWFLTSNGATASAAPMIGTVTPGTPASVAGIPTDTTITVSFSPPRTDSTPITGYEISTDGGGTWTPFSPTGAGSMRSGTVTGRLAATTYLVELRAINSYGTGTPSAAVPVTTLPAAPAAPTALAGPASTTVTWAQSPAGTVTGYTVYAAPGPATCATTSITDTSCVVGAALGVSYTYTVVAHGPAGDSAPSPPSNAVRVAAPPVPATAPTNAPPTLTTTDGVLSTVEPDQQVTVMGAGYAPHSTVGVISYGSPTTLLGIVVTDGSGSFTKQVTVPTSPGAGTHDLVASGVDASGALRLIRMPVTVAGAAAAGTSRSLPVTGSQVLLITVWAAALIGVALLLVAYAVRKLSAHQGGQGDGVGQGTWGEWIGADGFARQGADHDALGADR